MGYWYGYVLWGCSLSLCFCDWIEIPQAEINFNNEKFTKKPDVESLFLLTTTSTTHQTPILYKPSLQNKNLMPKRINNINPPKNNSATRRRISTVERVSLKNIQMENQVPNPQITDYISETVDNQAEKKVENTNFVEENEEHQETPEYSYESFIPFFSTIQSSLMKNAHQSKKSKVGVLQNLQDHLLYEIQTRINSVWKPNSEERYARDWKDESNVGFPSNEAALMTIGFLTFAVFLIKAVLHLIQAIHYKHATTTTTTTAAAFIRKKRYAEDEESLKIMNYIDDYPLK